MPNEEIKRYDDNLRDELNGAALYTALAAAEEDPVRKDLFLQLAQAESNHAKLWRDKLVAAGITPPPFVPSFRTRMLGRLAKRFRYRRRNAGMPPSSRRSRNAQTRRRVLRREPTSRTPSRGIEAPRATTCAPRYSARTTASCRTSV
jgi:hypothetical protein